MAAGAGDLIKLTDATAAPATLAVKKNPRREALLVVSCMVLLQGHREIIQKKYSNACLLNVTEK
jgi:hypothetical protein